MINSNRKNQEINDKKNWYILEWLIIFIIFLQKKMNRHLRNKRKDNELIDFYVPLFSCHFRLLVSDW